MSKLGLTLSCYLLIVSPDSIEEPVLLKPGVRKFQHFIVSIGILEKADKNESVPCMVCVKLEVADPFSIGGSRNMWVVGSESQVVPASEVGSRCPNKEDKTINKVPYPKGMSLTMTSEEG